MITCKGVFIKIARTYAQMQWFATLFLAGSLLETGPLPPKSKLDHILLGMLIIAATLTANFNNPLHIASFSTNQTSSNLELFIIIYLYIEAASVLNILIL